MSDLMDAFKDWVSADSQVKELWAKIQKGQAEYKDAQKYADLIGGKWSKLLRDAYSEADFQSVIAEIKAAIEKAYQESAYYAKNVQSNINESEGIGLKVIEPRLDEDRLNNFINKLFDGAVWLLNPSSVQSVTRAGVTDTIEANARMQSKAGLYAYIERDTGTGCCDWCESIAGRYIYGEQPSNFFQVHKDCTCTITYKPSKQRWQKITYSGGRKHTTTI